MKPMRLARPLVISLLALLLFLFGCDEQQSDAPAATKTGSIGIEVEWPPSVASQATARSYQIAAAASIDCAAAGVDRVEGIADNGDQSVSGGPWACEDGYGVIAVPGGFNYRIGVQALADDGSILFEGVTADVFVASGQMAEVTIPLSEPDDLLAAPANVTAEPGDGEVTLFWDEVPDADQYNLYFATVPDIDPDNPMVAEGGDWLANVNSPQDVSGLENGTTYYFAVSAEKIIAGDEVEGPLSGIVEVVPGLGSVVENPQRYTETNTGLEFVRIEAGCFQMGSPEDETGRFVNERRHQVCIEEDYYMGTTEVTRGAFARFVEATGYETEAESGDGCQIWTGSDWETESGRSWRDPGFDQGSTEPAVCVSWNDAVAYAEWLSEETGKDYRLPTEAEWEYAARAGTTTRYWWGDQDPVCEPGARNGARFFHDDQGCDDTGTEPVGTYQANPWGLYEVHGNVWEWTCSAYAENYDGSEMRCQTSDGTRLVRRGGSWLNGPRYLRAARRVRDSPAYREYRLGFRLARSTGGEDDGGNSDGGVGYQGLEAYYPFSGNANDESGNGNDGTINGATTGVTGKINEGISFDGVDDWVDTGYRYPDSNDFSVSFWLKSTDLGRTQYMIDTAISGGTGFRLYLTDGNLRLWSRDSSGSNVVKNGNDLPENIPFVADGNWHHIVAIWDNNSTEISLYLDDSLVYTESYSLFSGFNFLQDITIGSRIDLDSSSFYNGKIDEVGIWSRALTSTEISELYNNGDGLNPL